MRTSTRREPLVMLDSPWRRRPTDCRRGLGRACLFLLPIFSLLAPSVFADEVILKDGMILNGTTLQVAGLNSESARQNNRGPVPSFPYWIIDDGVRRFIVHRRIIAKHDEVADLGTNVSFKLKHKKSSRTAGFSKVGPFSTIQPFDEFGRRTVTLATQKGMIPIIQGITELRPQYTDLESLTHVWEYSIDTRMLPADVIQSVIEQSSDRDDPNERKAAILFYVQAQMFNEAQEELRQLKLRFPELTDWCQEIERQVHEYIARKAINEIERRRDAGQHALAYQFSRQFPVDDVSAEILQKAKDVALEYEQALIDRDRILMQLDLLQAELPEEEFDRLKSLRATVQSEMHYESLDRFEPFLRSVADETLTPSKKLALAYSGWLLGSANAVLDLDETIRLWDARFHVLEYLRLDIDPLRAQEILASIEAIEGVSPERMALMLPRLPLPFEPPPLEPGVVQEMEVATEPGSPSVKYTMMLPPEYTPGHHYPLLVVLRSGRTTFENELHFWAGDANRPGWALRRGYIVIAPHYCEENAHRYSASASAHEIVLKSINHLRKRFRVDSDRIFLAGHGMGGDACFDIGMSHPGIFAGVVPITGIAPAFCRAYWDNSSHLGWYIVSGERDRNSLEKNASTLNEMMRHGQDVIFCEYKARGYESYPEEQERIFEWMQTRRRVPLKDVSEFEANSVRISDHHFYWLEANLLPERLFPPLLLETDRPKLPRPKRYKGKITATGTIYISHPGKSTTIWLSPDIFDFDNRCHVRVNLKYVYNDFLKPSLEAMLSDVRDRGDRERLYWARLDL